MWRPTEMASRAAAPTGTSLPLDPEQPQLKQAFLWTQGKALDSFWYAKVLNLQMPQLSVPQDSGLCLRFPNI